jgi:hypothetical protein
MLACAVVQASINASGIGDRRSENKRRNTGDLQRMRRIGNGERS